MLALVRYKTLALERVASVSGILINGKAKIKILEKMHELKIKRFIIQEGIIDFGCKSLFPFPGKGRSH